MWTELADGAGGRGVSASCTAGRLSLRDTLLLNTAAASSECDFIASVSSRLVSSVGIMCSSFDQFYPAHSSLPPMHSSSYVTSLYPSLAASVRRSSPINSRYSPRRHCARVVFYGWHRPPARRPSAVGGRRARYDSTDRLPWGNHSARPAVSVSILILQLCAGRRRRSHDDRIIINYLAAIYGEETSRACAERGAVGGHRMSSLMVSDSLCRFGHPEH